MRKRYNNKKVYLFDKKNNKTNKYNNIWIDNNKMMITHHKDK